MLIIINKDTKQILSNMGTNPFFPDGNVPNVEIDDAEQMIKIHDDSLLAQRISTAYDYELVFEDDKVIDVIINKTLEEYQAEQPAPTPEPTEIEYLSNYLLDVDMRLVMVELGL